MRKQICGFVGRACHWLFANHVSACIEAVTSDLYMGMRGRKDVHDVRSCFEQHRLVIREGGTGTELLLDESRRGVRAIAYRHEIDDRRLCQIGQVFVGDRAASDDSGFEPRLSRPQASTSFRSTNNWNMASQLRCR